MQAELNAIGFTDYEAKVYIALLRESPATGYQLSKRTGVPRSMVYEALGRLQVRGAVLTTDKERATLYRPLPPDVLLDRYSQEQARLTRNLREGLRALHTSHEEDRYWTIGGRDTVLSYAGQMVRSGRSEVYAVLNDDALEALRDEIVAADARGASIGALLTGSGTLNCGQVARHPPRESELQELTHSLIVVVDNRESLVAGMGAEATATITRNRNLVMIARQFVWMELFAQRIYTRLGAELLSHLDPDDRRIFESFSPVPA